MSKYRAFRISVVVALLMACVALYFTGGSAIGEETPRPAENPFESEAIDPEEMAILGRKSSLDSLMDSFTSPEDEEAFLSELRDRVQSLTRDGKLHESVEILERLVGRCIAQGRRKELIVLRNSIGQLLGLLGDYSRSIQHLHRAYEYALQEGDTAQMLVASNLLAKHCAAMRNYVMARKYITQSQILVGVDTISHGGVQMLQVHGKVCLGQGKPLLAEHYFQRAATIAQLQGDSAELLGTLYDLVDARVERGALTMARVALDSMQQLQGRWASYLTRLYLLRATGHYEAAAGNREAAMRFYDSAYAMAEQLGNPVLQIETLHSLAQQVRSIGNAQRAYELETKAIQLQDSLQDYLSFKAFVLADIRAIQQVKQRDMRRESASHEAHYRNVQRRGRIVLLALGGVVLWCAFVLLLRRRIYRSRQELHAELVRREATMETKRQELVLLNEKVETLRAEALGQGQLIEQTRRQAQQHSDTLMSSIDHASTIQRAIYPHRVLLSSWLPESFILVRPRDLVTGDLPLVANLGKDVNVFAMADCQGRSVAGASLTFVVYMLLHEIIVDSEELNPDRIINDLSYRMARLLKDLRPSLRREMSLRLSVLTVERSAQRAHFAGLGQSLYHTPNRRTIHTVRGGEGMLNLAHDRPVDIPTYHMDFTPGTIFYLTSDGFFSQQNPDGIRLGEARFVEILEQAQPLPMSEQETYLGNQLMRYQLNAEQTDDITVFGFSVPS